ncbi:DJ-1/PfpI family protein [Francisella adeliensis]|uniref:DJ-1/PfpI family protein n=1 Tax=Francisella adeliensis TaxID=2007306 RepID=A0A2Z4XYV9_9GAMM|nr:DJ-1/PfpI family protein [Francisella adeliensis]AXA33856.1 dimethyladenosine transferase [Francisella adeliensis]MBK2085758.1 DJ-1/PfpI family protein [Francisella adeliensis]MBK2097636.1 DJ-1/PfpI family protein [Francisella adeliensis]QIW12093.1 DJ-1/PfpI family protein [Francisella adeliensis]QIW13967.1 DJ-1/PfpI family protein [Francisella adeliensis]
MLEIVTVLYNEFETLDVFGPIEILGSFKDIFKPDYYSLDGGVVTSSQGVKIDTQKLSGVTSNGYILFIPGGIGSRELVYNKKLIDALSKLATKAKYIFTVCTGSSLFSQTGLLDDKNATSNKKVMSWTKSIAPNVNWVDKARWVKDDNIYTSSGVSAGIDMSLGFIADTLGYDIAKQKSIEIEYSWLEDPSIDPFFEVHN